MRLAKNQSGMAIVEILLFVALAGIIGFAGYKVYSAKNSVDKSSANISQVSTKEVTSPSDAPSVDQASDLNKAQQTLDQVNPDDNNADSAQLDSQISSF